MSSYKCELIESGNETILKFSGDIDVDVALPDMDLAKIKKLVFDFEGLQGINSCGIREWVVWLRTIPETVHTVYRNCPRVLVDQFNMIRGVVREVNSEIESFYIPYYCDDCDEERKILQVGMKNVNPAKVMECPECKAEAELDILQAKYLKFIQMYSK